MKEFEKKIIVIFKWILILIPLLFILLSLLKNVWLTGKIAESGNYPNVNIETSVSDYYFDSINIDFFNYYEFKAQASNMLDAMPHGAFTNLYDFFTESQFEGFFISEDDSFLGLFICCYLDYIIFIELMSLCYYLFRYFIFFGIGLFERKKKL